MVDAATHTTTPRLKASLKTLKIEEVYLMEYETFDDVLPLCRASSRRMPLSSFEEEHARQMAN
jgi:hypothetical protein